MTNEVSIATIPRLGNRFIVEAIVWEYECPRWRPILPPKPNSMYASAHRVSWGVNYNISEFEELIYRSGNSVGMVLFYMAPNMVAEHKIMYISAGRLAKNDKWSDRWNICKVKISNTRSGNRVVKLFSKMAANMTPKHINVYISNDTQALMLSVVSFATCPMSRNRLTIVAVVWEYHYPRWPTKKRECLSF